ncbi:MAG: hypothetical protein ABJE47_17385, partial [bacterium]
AFPSVHAQGLRSRLTMTGTQRAYQIGDSSVSEKIGTMRYELFGSSWRIRLDGSSLEFRAPQDTIRGSLPFGVRFDLAARPGDTLTAFARSASRPLDLSARETSALSTIGTSVIDIESAALGTPALGGVRLALSFPTGDAVLSVRGGVELEPTPVGTQPVYWRGTTIRGGLALTSGVGSGSFAASIEATHSSADSLGGRNLFPGGGSLTLQLQGDIGIPNPFDPLEDETWPLRTIAFYGQPIGNDRNDQPNLIVPQGSLFGMLGMLVVPVRGLTISPTLQLLRESSVSGSSAGVITSRITGSAWTTQAGLDVTIPLGDVFELTPQAGYTVGNVGAAFSQSAVLRRGRGVSKSSAFNDAVRGSWFSLQLTASF